MKKLASVILVVVFCAIAVLLCGCKCKDGEHDYQKSVITKPTCTEKGLAEYVCSICGDTYQEEIKTEDHNYVSTVKTKPTCTKEGINTLKCSKCGDTKEETVKANGHDYMSEETKKPNCITKGVVTYTCKVCKDTYTEETPVDKNVHNFAKEAAKVTKAATCKDKGVMTYSCVRCGATKTEDIPATGHNYQSTSSGATCTSAGSVTYKCANCGDSYSETVAALGHSWSDATCTAPKKCSRCGTTEGSALGHTTSDGTCSRCGTRIYGIGTIKSAVKSYFGDAVNELDKTIDLIADENNAAALLEFSYYIVDLGKAENACGDTAELANVKQYLSNAYDVSYNIIKNYSTSSYQSSSAILNATQQALPYLTSANEIIKNW